MKKFVLIITSSALLVTSAFAFDNENDHNDNSAQATPFVYVGKAGDCGSAAGSRIVTSAWLAGMGLPDDGTSLNGAASSRNDPHFGLLLSKNGPTADCSSAGVTIRGVGNITVPVNPATLVLGFDVRNGTHCGAGAPRFNIVTSDNVTHFAGCADGTITTAPQDPAHWSRVRFTPAQIFPSLLAGEQIKTISIVYDEGTDSTSTQDPMGVGLAVIDNINVNGHTITAGPAGGTGEDNDSRNKGQDNEKNN